MSTDIKKGVRYKRLVSYYCPRCLEIEYFEEFLEDMTEGLKVKVCVDCGYDMVVIGSVITKIGD